MRRHRGLGAQTGVKDVRDVIVASVGECRVVHAGMSLANSINSFSPELRYVLPELVTLPSTTRHCPFL